MKSYNVINVSSFSTHAELFESRTDLDTCFYNFLRTHPPNLCIMCFSNGKESFLSLSCLANSTFS